MKNDDHWIQTGIALQQKGELKQAENLYKQILSKTPDNPDAIHLLGMLAYQSHQYDKAVQMLSRAASLRPDAFIFHGNLGIALLALGRIQDAIHAYETAVSLKPDFAEAHYNLGMALCRQKQFVRAEQSLNRALELTPQNAQIHNGLGLLLAETQRTQAAAQRFQNAVRINPGHAQAHCNLGIAQNHLGHTKEAILSFRNALAADPGHAQAFHHLAGTKRFHRNDPDIRAMEDQLKRSTANQQIYLSFALGKAYEEIESYDRAFQHFQRGNCLKRATAPYNPSHHTNLVQYLKSAFSQTHFNTHRTDQSAQSMNKGGPGADPVFIIGMPRSGTSLVEQILSSHPQVLGRGELSHLSHILTRFSAYPDTNSPARLLPDRASKMGEAYLDLAPPLPQGVRYITDKMPSNFFHIGMIAQMLPSAKIIHCQRNPGDLAWSIYKTLFSFGHEFSYDLSDIGRYYLAYRELMAHWDRIFKNRCFEITYESLTQTPKDTIQDLLNYLDLEWNDHCLAFHRSRREVKTASVNQVRQPIHTRSIGQWQHYRPWLAPLLNILPPPNNT